MRHVAKKVAAVEGGLVWFRDGITTGMYFSGQVDLYMTERGKRRSKKEERRKGRKTKEKKTEERKDDRSKENS